MNEGLKVDSGDKLGKTIIFAQNHKHAEVIVDRFNKLYPEYGNDFCRLIDYSVKYVGTVINDFKVKDKEPVIAVSVDMLDTGIDIPEIIESNTTPKPVFLPIALVGLIFSFDGFSTKSAAAGKSKAIITRKEITKKPPTRDVGLKRIPDFVIIH